MPNVKNHTPAELVRALEYVAYEIRMLVGALSLAALRADVRAIAAPELAALALSNATVELRALHARNVCEFLQPHKPKSNFVVAQHYLPRFAVNDASLMRVWSLASRYLAHITADRVTDHEHAAGEKSKAWELAELAPILRAALEFVDGLLVSNWLREEDNRRAAFQEARTGLAELLAAIPHGDPLSM